MRRFGAAVAALLAILPAWHFAAAREDRARTLRLMEEHRVRELFPQAARRIENETSAVWARLHLARVLVGQTLDGRWLLPLPAAGVERELAQVESRLRLGREIALRVLSERPVNATAPMLIGAATYRSWLGSGDARLVTSPTSWEAPLTAAASMAPGDVEPPRLLSAAYLTIWPTLSDEKRRKVAPVLRDAFRDETTFLRLAEVWFSVAPDDATAVSLVPDTPDAWRNVMAVFARRGDWRQYADARVRWDQALFRHLEEKSRAASQFLEGGDARRARTEWNAVVLGARLDRRFAPLIDGALSRLPPGVSDPRQAPRLARVLDWALDECVRGRCALSPVATSRLLAGVGESEPSLAALAAVAAGDLAGAERQERRFGALGTDAWSPYVLLKARALVERGRADEARALVERVGRGWRDRPQTLLARGVVAAALDNEAGVRAARDGLLAQADVAWPPTAWVFDGRVTRLLIVPRSPGSGLEIALDEVPGTGAVVEVRWDGVMHEVRDVRPGSVLHVGLDATPTSHVLDLETVAGRRVRPGAVRLVEATPSPDRS